VQIIEPAVPLSVDVVGSLMQKLVQDRGQQASLEDNGDKKLR